MTDSSPVPQCTRAILPATRVLLDPIRDVHALDVSGLNDRGRVRGVRGTKVQVVSPLPVDNGHRHIQAPRVSQPRLVSIAHINRACLLPGE